MCACCVMPPCQLQASLSRCWMPPPPIPGIPVTLLDDYLTLPAFRLPCVKHHSCVMCNVLVCRVLPVSVCACLVSPPPGIPVTVLDDYPAIKAFVTKVGELEAISKYYAAKAKK